MTTMPATQARDHLSELLNKVYYTGERIVIESRGKQKAVLVSLGDAEVLEAIETKADLALIKKRASEPSEPWEKVKMELGL